MKRSRAVPLGAFSLVTAAALTACGENPPQTTAPPAFTTVQECVDSGGDRTGCQAAFDRAMAQHAQSAPRFDSDISCRLGADVERCVPTRVRRDDNTFADVFIPAMTGYVLGRMTANDRRDDDRRGGGYYGGSWSYGNAGPIYRAGRSSGYRTSEELARSRPASVPGVNPRPPSGWTRPFNAPTVSTPSRPANVGTVAISRSGFGGRAASFGGGGGHGGGGT